MKKLILIGMIIACTRVSAQVDEKRMERDLEVAKNILGTLVSDNNDMMFFNSREIEATYLPGYGVIFSLPENPMFWNFRIPRIPKIRIHQTGDNQYRYDVHVDAGDSEDNHIEVIGEVPDVDDNNNVPDAVNAEVQKEVQKSMMKQQKALEAEQEAASEQQDALEAEKDAKQEYQDQMKEEQQSSQEQQEHMRNAIMTFFADYADLISQLGPESRIRVVEKSSPGFEVLVWTSEDNDKSESKEPGFSAEVYKKDISAYKAGKITLDEFHKKVNFEEAKKSVRSADLDLFSKILKGYFNPDVTKSYFVEGNPTYERISNFGVIYNLKAFSSYQDEDEFRFPSTGDKKFSLEERNKKVEQMYPTFESDIKNFIVDYGRTIRSLGDNEMLMLKIRLTKCEGCSIPKSIDVSVKGSVLAQYDQQKINREKALASIEVKKNN
jgi:hypothetical protein